MCARKYRRMGEVKIGWVGEFPPHTHFRQHLCRGWQPILLHTDLANVSQS